MGTITHAQYRTRVYDRLGLPTTDGHVTSAQVTSALNAALQEYATEYDWPWLQAEETVTTAADDEGYALPTRYARTLYVLNDADNENLEYRPAQALVQYAGRTDRPLYYSGLWGELVLSPTPDAVYTLRHGYVRAEAEFSADGDTALLPDAFAEFLVTIAARKIAVRRKDTELHRLLSDEYQAWVTRLRNEVRRTAFLGRVRAFDRGFGT